MTGLQTRLPKVTPAPRTHPRPGRRYRQEADLIDVLPYLAPSLLVFAVFVFYPLLRTFYLSLYLTDPQGKPAVYMGLRQFVEMLGSDVFRNDIRATALFALYTVPTSIGFALLLAVLANARLRGIGFFRTVFSSSIAVSVATASTVFLLLYHPSLGMFNYLLSKVGITAVQWLTSPDIAMIAVALTTVWMNTGFNFIVILSGLQGIPEELYESGSIDGARGWMMFRHITFPLLTPTLFFLLVVGTVSAFQAFGQIDLLTRGGPAGTTEVLVYGIYREAFFNFQFGTASVLAVIVFLMVLVLTLVQFGVLERKVFYS
mgnify:CR=1 FL=1